MTMRWLAVAMMLTIAPGLAMADAVVPPAGWKVDTDKATAQAARIGKLPHFAGAPTEFSASVLVPPSPGVVLYVTRLSTKQNSPAALRAALDDFELPTREPGVQVGNATKRVDEANKLVVATIGVRDKGAQLATQSALVAAADAQHLVVVTADCISNDEADAKLVEACRTALTTLDPDVKTADRVAIALPPAADQLPSIDHGSSAPGTETASPPSKMGDGSRMVMPPMVVPQDSQTDRRPIYIGAGLVILAAVFWWNRRRRESFERDDDDAREGHDATAKPARTASRDDDADDLHAAAAGDADDADATAATTAKKADADD